MTPKEKAKELVDKFRFKKLKYLESDTEPTVTIILLSQPEGIRAALIAVDFAIDNLGTKCSECQDEQNKILNELIELKQEIEKL